MKKNSLFVLVLNCGSSSVKYSLFKDDQEVLKGLKENIGLKTGEKNHQIALEKIFEEIKNSGVIKDLKEIKHIGHRVVHGGEIFKKPTLITKNNLEKLKSLSYLAPLHNPFNVLGIELCLKLLPSAKNYAVFDTEFYSSFKEESFLYGLPYEFYEKYSLRKYGFHGISHQYITRLTEKILKHKAKKIITCHLGAGSSITAILNGQPIDTSMGFTPLEGLIMETRCGNIDPTIPLFLIKNHGFTPDQLDEIFNKKSGFLGICGLRDFRDVLKMETKKSKLCYEMYLRSVVKTIGSYISLLNGTDAIVFTAGIGEGSAKFREDVLKHFEYLGVKIDKKKNYQKKTIISSNQSKVKVLVLPTNETLMIYQQIKEKIKK